MNYNKKSIGMIEVIIIINVILFIPFLLLFITNKTFSFPYKLVSFFLNLNINHPYNYLSISDGAYWQVITAMFMHGGIFHILFNMYGLYIFGKPLEIMWGKWKFLAFYLTTGILANIASVFIFSYFNNSLSLLGASGAVYAVLLAFGGYFPETKLLLYFFIPLKVKWAILVFAVIELFSEITGVPDGIAHITHLFGFLFAFLLLIIFFKINPIQKMFFPKKIDYIIQ